MAHNTPRRMAPTQESIRRHLTGMNRPLWMCWFKDWEDRDGEPWVLGVFRRRGHEPFPPPYDWPRIEIPRTYTAREIAALITTVV